MGPVQPNTQQQGGEKKKITLEQLIAQSESDGFEVEGKPEAAPDMSMEEKVRKAHSSRGAAVCHSRRTRQSLRNNRL